jgi:hypothetical protein
MLLSIVISYFLLFLSATTRSDYQTAVHMPRHISYSLNTPKAGSFHVLKLGPFINRVKEPLFLLFFSFV